MDIELIKNVIKVTLKCNLNIETETKRIAFIPMNLDFKLYKSILDNIKDISISKSTITSDNRFMEDSMIKIWDYRNIKDNHFNSSIVYNYYDIKGMCIVIKGEFEKEKHTEKEFISSLNFDRYVFNISFLTVLDDDKEILVSVLTYNDYIKFID